MASFTQWLDSASAFATDDTSSTALTNLRNSPLAEELGEKESTHQTWLTTAFQKSTGVFTCSGYTVLSTDDPVRMSFDIASAAEHARNTMNPRNGYDLALPFTPAATKEDVDAVMSAILPLCRPATFGVGGQAVLDETYRSCAQMPPSQFWCNFAPEQGQSSIIRETARVLCTPSLGSTYPLRAELYKLNIYAAGGKFKTHRDTPRASNMLGSLVVCLPFPHEGGALIVRQGGRSVTHDWSFALNDTDENCKDAQNRIQWAAFYGDCEHEILEVTSGYRVTLTYNLYTAEEPSATLSPGTDAHFLNSPFHSLLCLFLRTPSFLPEGGLVGVRCEHGYAHTSNAMIAVAKPSLLKGIDAVVYDGIRQLGLSCEFIPGVGSHLFANFQTLQKLEYWDDEIGFVSDEESEIMGKFATEGIVWVNEKGVKEAQAARPTYGNSPELNIVYSIACLMVHIPSWDGASNKRSASSPTPSDVFAASGILHPSHHHPLFLHPPYPFGGGFYCSKCKKWNHQRELEGVHHCYLCQYDLCERCFAVTDVEMLT